MNASRQHILVVDDEEVIISLLKDYLESLEYEVTAVTSAEDAIHHLSNGRAIDLILSDINLPGMTGIELLKIARETKPEISVVLITGFKTLDYAISAIKHGAQDYITKPFDLTNVRRVIEKVLRRQNKAHLKKKIFEHTRYFNIHLAIPTRDAEPGVLADYFSKILLNSGFCDENEFNQYNLAFTEAFINALEHGNLELSSSIKGDDFGMISMFEELREQRMEDPAYGERTVSVSFEFRPEVFTLNITDEGPGFDWQQYVTRDHQFKEINTESHGRGFLIIRHIVDEVYFNKMGNSITLVKYKKSQQ